MNIKNVTLLSSRKWENYDRWGRCGMGLRLKERRLVGEVVDIAPVNSSLARSPLVSLPAVFWMSRNAPPFLVRPRSACNARWCKLILVFPLCF